MNVITINDLNFRVHKGLITTLSLLDSEIDDIGDPQLIIKKTKERDFAFDLLTFCQTLKDRSPKFSYPMEWDNLAVLFLSTYDNWFRSQVSKNTRNSIRKAEKAGIYVTVEHLNRKVAEGLVGIFNESKIRRGRPYEYYGATPDSVLRDWSLNADRSDFLLAHHEEDVVGFIQLIYGNEVATAAGTVAKMSYRKKAPMNALWAKAVEICCDRGVKYLVYGKYTYGKGTGDSLTTFKKHNGFQEVKIPLYFVPVTVRGKIAVFLGVHRGIAAILPASWHSFLVTVRSKLYEKMMH